MGSKSASNIAKICQKGVFGTLFFAKKWAKVKIDHNAKRETY